jgi:serine/threonine-protein phosphatase 2A catalytic subunit
MSSPADVDGWISQLSECKQLSEADIKQLCDKVKEDTHDNQENVSMMTTLTSFCTLYRPEKFSLTSPMSNLFGAL